MIVVDTTILVYAAGSPHEHAEPSRRLFDAVAAGRLEATTTVEVIQEFAHAFSRRRPRADAVAHARRYATLLGPLLVTDASQLDVALGLFERHERLDAFDALVAAAALASRADHLVSADAGFAEIDELAHVPLGSPAFESLLAA